MESSDHKPDPYCLKTIGPECIVPSPLMFRGLELVPGQGLRAIRLHRKCRRVFGHFSVSLRGVPGFDPHDSDSKARSMDRNATDRK